MRTIASILLAFACLFGMGANAQEQRYPDRTVKFIVPWPAGGGADFMARTFGKELSALWGQPVIFENVGGAGSIIGAERAATATPDGYTLMLTINGTVVSNRFMYKKLPYDPDKDLVPVSLLVKNGMLILSPASLQASNLRELVELARREPEKVVFASYGNGTQPHLLFETMNKRESIRLLHVPYRGLAPAVTAVTAGEAQLTLVTRSSAEGAMATGRVKALAIGSDKRDPKLPEVPTVREAGYPYLEAPVWFGVFAPAGTPPELAQRIQQDIAKVLRQPKHAADQTARGFELVGSTPAEFAAFIKQEVATTAEMVEAAGVKPE